MRILVTGGCGFIGSNLVDELNSFGHIVDVVDDLSSGDIDNIDSEKKIVLPHFLSQLSVKESRIGKVLIITSDFCDKYIINSILENKYDVVYHLAANPSVSYSFDFPMESHEVNLTKAFKIFHSCAKSGTKLIFSSSSSVYGNAEKIPTKETHDLNPLSPYGIQKMTCENYIKFLSKNYDLNYVILRYSNVYGPKSSGGEYKKVIPSWLNSIKNKEIISFEGSGDQLRDFIFIDDVTKANSKCINKNIKNQIYNISSCKTTCNKEILSSILNINPKIEDEIKINYLPERKSEIPITQLLNKKAINAKLISNQMVDFETGLKKTMKWFGLI